MQASQIKGRSAKFVHLTEAVAQRLEMNEQLSLATDEASRIIRKHEHIEHLDRRNTTDRVARAEIYFKRMVMQNKLRRVTLTQTRELVHLFAEKQALLERSFPTFRQGT